MWCVMLTNNRGAKKIIAARRPDGADEKVCQAKICEIRGFVTVNCRYTLTSTPPAALRNAPAPRPGQSKKR